MATYSIDKDGFDSWSQGDEEEVKTFVIAAFEVKKVYACVGREVTLIILRIDPDKKYFDIRFQGDTEDCTDDCDEEIKDITHTFGLRVDRIYHSVSYADLIAIIGTENLIQRGGIL